jgi:hypothetical protein
LVQQGYGQSAIMNRWTVTYQLPDIMCHEKLRPSIQLTTHTTDPSTGTQSTKHAALVMMALGITGGVDCST